MPRSKFTSFIVFLFLLLTSGLFFLSPISAASKDPNLVSIYLKRPDLQKAFDKKTWQAKPGTVAGALIDLEDWARQYGWKEYQKELEAFAPTSPVPVRVSKFVLPPEVTADNYIVVDRHNGLILAQKNAGVEWPIASLTKLMTTSILLDQKVSLSSRHAILATDEVGGARLNVAAGTTFTLDELISATLVASANNAATALSHATPLSRDKFISAMNTKATSLNLSHTRFVDPSGIETGNVSTPREFARLASDFFSNQKLRYYTTRATVDLALPDGSKKNLKNSNWLLWKPQYDDIYVMSGKTGYLDESGWNLVVSLRPTLSDPTEEVLIVLFAADSRAASFEDAKALAEWAWDNYTWTKV